MAVSAKLILISLGTSQLLAYEVQDQIKSQALTLLRSRRKNTGFFEESRDDDFQRECVEELCSAEELREIFPNSEAERALKWSQLTKQCYLAEKKCNAQGTKVCVQTWNDRTCKCKDGFTGEKCDEDIDECALGNEVRVCPENAKCSNSVGGYSCNCEYGFDRTCADDVENCDETNDFTCVKQTIVCEGDNKIIKNGICGCIDGFEQDQFSGDCQDIDECSLGFCDDEDNTYCVNSQGGFECKCESGYESLFDTCQDIDECADPEKADSCGNGICKNLDGGFTCECNKGYELSEDATCVNIDECKDGNVCFDNEVCFDTDGHFFCCPSGHTFIDGNCVNVACEGVQCNDDQSCREGVCYCNNIYEEVVDGTCVDVDECSQGIHTCNDNQICKNLVSSGYECACPSGFLMLDGDCINPNDQSGVEYEGSSDPTDSTEEPTQPATEAPETDAPTEPATEPGPVTTETPTYCPAGFEIAVIDRSGREGCVDVDECQTDNGGCKHPNGMCLNYYGSNFCYGELEQEKVICHHYHVDAPETDEGYVCKCYDGYSLCHDQITCVADERMVFSTDNSAECSSDAQISYLGTCYQLSTGTANYEDAAADCQSLGGSLATVNSREVWWWLGNMIDHGTKPFYVNNDSDVSVNGANMYVVGDGGDNYLVNIVPSMNAVPPQWNSVDGSEAHRYWCQF